MDGFKNKYDYAVILSNDSDFFKTFTGISKDDFSELCNKGFIRREALNGIVRDFLHQEESSLKPEEYIFQYIQNKKKLA